ncbi:MAG: DMT family transporter [Gracilibacteraceae bacterium]|jgi:drug/metabolite transporter (DMT)-like permease|nr:DMT family transporter [Gracilibacteraceae bacterium]
MAGRMSGLVIGVMKIMKIMKIMAVTKITAVMKIMEIQRLEGSCFMENAKKPVIFRIPKQLIIAGMVLFALIFGYSFIVLKNLISAGFPIWLLLAFRFFFGTLLLLALRRAAPFQPFDRATVRAGLLVGAAIFLAYAFQTFGLELTTPAKNGLFTGLYVIIVPLIMMALKRKISWRPLLTAPLCFAGIACVSGVWGEALNLNNGDALTICCALFFAFHLILLERYAPVLPALNFSAVQLGTVALCAAALSWFTEKDAYAAVAWAAALPGLLFLTVFSTGLAFFFQTLAQSRISANTTAVVLCLESVFAVIFSVFYGFDRFTFSFAAGSVLIIAAMLLVSLNRREEI